MVPDNSRVRDGSLLARGAIVTTAGRGTTGAVQLLAQILAARLLGPAGFGIWAVGLTVVRAMGTLLAWGLSQSIIRFGSVASSPGVIPVSREVDRLVLLGVGAGLCGGGLLLVGGGWLGSVVFNKPDLGPVLRIMAPALAAFATIEVLAATTRLTKKMQYSALARDLGPATLHLSLLGVCFVTSLGLREASVATSTAYVLGAGLAFLVVRRIPRAAGITKVIDGSEILRYTGVATAAGLFGFITTRVDLLFVGVFMDSASTGHYAAAVQFALIFSLLMAAFGTVFAPLSAELFSLGQVGRLRTLYRSTTRWGLYVTVPLIIPLLLFSPDVLTLLYGDEFVGASAALRVLLLGQLVHISLGLVYTLMMMTGGERLWLRMSAVAALLATGLPILLIPQLGIVGAAVSTAATTTFLMVAGVWSVRVRFGALPHDSHSWRVLLLAGSCTGAVLLTRLVPDAAPGLAVALAFLASGTVAWLTLLAAGVHPEDRELLRLIKNRDRTVG